MGNCINEIQSNERMNSWMNKWINKGIYGNRDSYNNVAIEIRMSQINEGDHL
jgi:Arc/MetJ-type ribon-helix-helix transcriptional regulator